MRPTPVKAAAEAAGIPVATPEKARAPEFIKQIRSLDADMLVVASYGQILSQELLNSARRGGINLHGSLLPRYRGAAPIQRCIQAGDTETGVTLMQMDKGMDTGDIIAIVRTPIDPDEIYGEVQERLAILAASLIVEWAPRIADGDYPRCMQEASEATMAPKVGKDEAALSFEANAREQYNAFRAFNPSPGAFIRTAMGNVKISSARLSDAEGQPGTMLAGGAGCRVAFMDGSLDLLEVQPEGKKRMTGKDFVNGARLRPGTSLQ
jgi:methionyl-tRNA formyltransferase